MSEELFKCVMSNNVKGVGWLLKHKKVDINATDEYGNTCLHVAVTTHWKTMVEMLLSHLSVEDVNKHNNKGYTALHNACYNEQYTIAKVLIQSPKVNINQTDANGQTVLTQVVNTYSGIRYILLKLLLDRGDIDVNLVDNEGKTALHHAVYKDYKIVGLLLCNNKIDVNVVDNDNKIALWHAYVNGNIYVINLIRAHINNPNNGDKQCVTNTLFDVNAKDKYGMSLLHHASIRGCNQVIKLLLSYPDIDVNATVNMHDHRKNKMIACNALYMALEYRRHDNIIELLVISGVSINLDINDINGRYKHLLESFKYRS